MLLATRHKRTHPTLTPASKAGTRFTFPGRIEGWVDLGDLIMPRPGIEPTTAWWKVRRPNSCATKTRGTLHPFRGYTLFVLIAPVQDDSVETLGRGFVSSIRSGERISTVNLRLWHISVWRTDDGYDIIWPKSNAYRAAKKRFDSVLVRSFLVLKLPRTLGTPKRTAHSKHKYRSTPRHTC